MVQTMTTDDKTRLKRLQSARDKAHNVLSDAEYKFTLANRELEAFKRELRMAALQGDKR